MDHLLSREIIPRQLGIIPGRSLLVRDFRLALSNTLKKSSKNTSLKEVFLVLDVIYVLSS
jgi:hypothetical protein